MHIGILGGGPSGLFIYKRLVECGYTDFKITIFERKDQLGAGMPYSKEGANEEHITNVSDNEIPEIVKSIKEWIQNAPPEILKLYNINTKNFNEYKVLPRLFFGEYLAAQFAQLQQKAKKAGIETNILLNTIIADVVDEPELKKVKVITAAQHEYEFDCAIICTGHNWPKKFEGVVPGFYDSPYPPSKLAIKINYAVAIKGSSLTAIDAIRTLARYNGKFIKSEEGLVSFKLHEQSEGFKIIMHSRSGMLPAIRFHLEDSHLSKDSVMSKDELMEVRNDNNGFVPLDYLFEKHFKDGILEQDPAFYTIIQHMKMEEFVTHVMNQREHIDPFLLMKAEYAEAAKSIKRKQSVYWKEMLAVLSFALNYPAKYLSAEDMLRLQKVLMPLISIVIAFVPQSSVEEMLALHHAGLLTLIPVGDDSTVKPHDKEGAVYTYTDEDEKQQKVHYKLYVDCVGQPHLSFEDFPFKSLVTKKSLTPARLKFKLATAAEKELQQGNKKIEKDKESNYYLQVPGVTINDNFQVLDQYGAYNEKLYMMAVPYIGGFNPDYSGLDFSEAASARIIKSIATKLTMQNNGKATEAV
jgi:FAD-NAD(P)-binding